MTQKQCNLLPVHGVRNQAALRERRNLWLPLSADVWLWPRIWHSSRENMFSPTRGAAKVAKDGDDFMAIRTAGARGSAPGERRGGRAKGTPNRQTQLVRDRLAELNCDPVQGLVKIATDPSNTPELRAKVYADLLAFSAPKPKAIELTAGEMAEPQELIVRWLPSSE